MHKPIIIQQIFPKEITSKNDHVIDNPDFEFSSADC